MLILLLVYQESNLKILRSRGLGNEQLKKSRSKSYQTEHLTALTVFVRNNFKVVNLKMSYERLYKAKKSHV